VGAVDQHGQIIDVYVSARRDTTSARRFFETALDAHGEPVEVVTDGAPALRALIEELIPAAFHNTEQYANNRIEADHSRLKSRLRPMRGLKRDHTARVIMRGHALMQNIRRGHYELRACARRPRDCGSPTSSTLRHCHTRLMEASRSRWSLWSEDSLLSIGSKGSILSIGSAGSILSVGSAGSFLSIFSIGSFSSIGSALSSRSRWSLMSHGARWGLMRSG
jgi:hypothetical protein